MSIDPSVMCHCGSGLRAVRCCLVEPVSMVAANSAVYLAPTTERARQAFKIGNAAVAEELSLAVLDLSPYDPDALLMLSQIRLAQNNHSAAKALLSRLVKANPNLAVQLTQLARLHMEVRELKDAERVARMAIRADPTLADAHNVLGMILSEAGELIGGEACYRHTIAMIDQPDAIILANLAWNLTLQGRFEEAASSYEQSLSLAPDVPQTVIGHALLERKAGRLEKARDILSQAYEKAGENRFLAVQYAAVLNELGLAAQALDIVNALPGEDITRSFFEWKERGNILYGLGRYEDAFAAWQEGGRAPDAPLGVGPVGLGGYVERLKSFFTATKLGLISAAAKEFDGGIQPIFVVGASSQITAPFGKWIASTISAPTIALGPLLSSLIERLPEMVASPYAYPEALADLWMADRVSSLRTLREKLQDHFRSVQAQGQDKSNWIVNIDPLDETQIGLIALLFPYAPIIHLIDHPLSSAVRKFASSTPVLLEYDGTIEGAAEYVKAMSDIAEHMRSNFVLKYLPVKISDLLQNQSMACERITNFVSFEPVYGRQHSLTLPPIMGYEPFSAHLAEASKILSTLIQARGFEAVVSEPSTANANV
ncbi:Tetratricopeptide repeat family protein [Granulibacter bethesdensis CGDNIH4]|nr:Tetratricopeptide repeat family protein [Granulibacter bethesdensis CGDNIH4]